MYTIKYFSKTFEILSKLELAYANSFDILANAPDECMSISIHPFNQPIVRYPIEYVKGYVETKYNIRW